MSKQIVKPREEPHKGTRKREIRKEKKTKLKTWTRLWASRQHEHNTLRSSSPAGAARRPRLRPSTSSSGSTTSRRSRSTTTSSSAPRGGALPRARARDERMGARRRQQQQQQQQELRHSATPQNFFKFAGAVIWMAYANWQPLCQVHNFTEKKREVSRRARARHNTATGGVDAEMPIGKQQEIFDDATAFARKRAQRGSPTNPSHKRDITTDASACSSAASCANYTTSTTATIIRRRRVEEREDKHQRDGSGGSNPRLLDATRRAAGRDDARAHGVRENRTR